MHIIDDPSGMKCSNCGGELAADAGLACPFCGRVLANDAVVPPRVGVPATNVNWLLFFGALLVPPMLTALIVQGGRATQGLAVAIALLGGGAGGIITGGILGRRLGQNLRMKVLFGLLFAGVMVVACIGMCCFGCLAGGFRLDFK